MPNIATVLKAEIARLSRREINKAVSPVRKAAASHRRDIAALKRTVAELLRQVRTMAKSQQRTLSAATPERTKPLRFRAAGLVSLRKRLGLSAESLGQLLDVSGQTVYNWERGKSAPGRQNLAAIATLRTMGKREALLRVSELAKKAAPSKKA